jgi:hypothetical protein
MTYYLFKQPSRLVADHVNENAVFTTLKTIANTTVTNDLIVALYVVRKTSWTGGAAYVQQWVTPKQFCAIRGKWTFTGRFGVPADLPPKFKLIRMLLRGDINQYPLTERDRYDWEHCYATFEDHLALLFAHELHHYRRHHLGLHPRGGEHSANLWAVELVQQLRFNVQSRRIRRRKPKVKPRRLNIAELFNPLASTEHGNLPTFSDSTAWQKIVMNASSHVQTKTPEQLMASQQPHFERLRRLPLGTKLLVAYDPTGRYQGKLVRLIRPMKRNSVRIVVETSDGKKWRWPMAWLEETSTH